ncbi:MAG: hypothetical protein KC910_06885 [Candidatus Eremiobacteraeota bacterium]|nr:hypothetical protein [Candidatus Eremiobacteraeota bacterium]
MRRVAELGFLLVILAISAALTRQPIGLAAPVELAGKYERNRAIELVAQQAGFEVIGRLEGEVDLDLQSVPAQQALDKIVDSDEWKLIGRRLLLLPTHDIRSSETCGQEFLLESASARELLPLLQKRFPALVLRPHPTLNGFYGIGPLVDMLALKRLLAAIDRAPLPSGPIPFQAGAQSERVIQAVEREFPEVSFTRGSEGWTASVPLSRQPELVDRIDLLSRTRQTVTVPGRLKPGCKLDREWDVYYVACSPGCQGALHQLGLEPGDTLSLGWTRLERAQPRWRLTRRKTKLLIELN